MIRELREFARINFRSYTGLKINWLCAALGPDDALEFEAGPAKIDQDSNFISGCFEVIEHLRFFARRQLVQM